VEVQYVDERMAAFLPRLELMFDALNDIGGQAAESFGRRFKRLLDRFMVSSLHFGADFNDTDHRVARDEGSELIRSRSQTSM
jgi:hypothetical protein